MFLLSIIFFISSISVTIRRDVSILLSRTAVIIISCCLQISVYTFDFFYFINKLGIFNGLFHITHITQIFKSFVFMISAIILLLTSYYPRKHIKETFFKTYKKGFIHDTLSENFIKDNDLKKKDLKIIDF